MTHIVYLDEFGHIGPFVSRSDTRHNTSPVFGLAGIVLPISEVRAFSTWFFQRKQELLGFEINRSGAHPATWEKKGSALYTLKNVQKYPELRRFTNRLFNKIQSSRGHVFYVGIEKTATIADHDPKKLYIYQLREAIKRLDQYCHEDCASGSSLLMVLDEHTERENLVTAAAQAMFSSEDPRRRLVEPPFQVESERYQTVQAADWIAAIVARIGAVWIQPEQYSDWAPFRTYFESRLNRVSTRSGIRSGTRATMTDLGTEAIIRSLAAD
ncbi:DUF3800 domain-containing protein [Nisaea sp.]|uniref:DUF3800 domain-containing protein n=1 Tax=Nisaea sp. TaxID=2024842 RepID=UPI003264848E